MTNDTGLFLTACLITLQRDVFRFMSLGYLCPRRQLKFDLILLAAPRLLTCVEGPPRLVPVHLHVETHLLHESLAHVTEPGIQVPAV